MEGGRKGNRGAHSAGGKSALFIFSSFQHLSFSLCPCLPYIHLPPSQSSPLFSLFHTLLHAPSRLRLSLSLSSPLSLTVSPTSPLPPSVFHRGFRKSQPLPSIYEIAHVISCPPPSLPTHPLCAQLSLVTLSGCILSPQIVPVWPNPPPSKHTAQWPVLLKKQKFIPRVIFSDSTTSP